MAFVVSHNVACTRAGTSLQHQLPVHTSRTCVRGPVNRGRTIVHAASEEISSTEDSKPSTSSTPSDSPFGISGVRTEQDDKTKELQKMGNKYADDENPWAAKKPSSKLKFTDIVPWDEFMQVYDQDTCYQRLYRTLVTTLVYRKNVMVTQEHWSELANILVPMLMDDGFIYGLDGVPREHKAWRIVDRWVEAVVEDDRAKRLRGEVVKPAKVGTRSSQDRTIRMSPEKMVSNPGNRHRDFRGDDYRLPDSINALPDA